MVERGAFWICTIGLGAAVQGALCVCLHVPAHALPGPLHDMRCCTLEPSLSPFFKMCNWHKHQFLSLPDSS